MKNITLLISGVILSFTLFASCASEEAVVQESKSLSQKSFNSKKSDDMLKFEDSLKEWTKSKQLSAGKEVDPMIIKNLVQNSKKLLISIDKRDVADNPDLSVDELVRETMKLYSKELTRIFNQ